MTTDASSTPDPRAWQAWPAAPGVPDPAQLALLVTGAAAQAAVLLTGAPFTGGAAVDDPFPDDEVDGALVDAVRLLATPDGGQHVPAAAERTGLPQDDLRRLVLAHRHGGPAGVAAALAPTTCDGEDLARAAEAVRRRRAFSADPLATSPGEITDVTAGIRLRLGPDRRWYPFTHARDQWWPAPGAAPAAETAYQAAVRARSLRRATT